MSSWLKTKYEDGIPSRESPLTFSSQSTVNEAGSSIKPVPFNDDQSSTITISSTSTQYSVTTDSAMNKYVFVTMQDDIPDDPSFTMKYDRTGGKSINAYEVDMF